MSTQDYSRAMDEELLISLVRERTELYDTEHKLYEDSIRREMAWQEIAVLTQVPAHECRDRWKRLRDNYRRARKLRQIKKQQGFKRIKTIKHEKVLSFLDSIIEQNRSNPTEPFGDDSESAGSSMGLLRVKYEEPETPVTPERTYTEETKKPDTVVTFFANLGETVKSFPEEIQIRVKRDIFKIINEAEEEVYLSKIRTGMNMKCELSDF